MGFRYLNRTIAEAKIVVSNPTSLSLIFIFHRKKIDTSKSRTLGVLNEVPYNQMKQ